MTSVLKKRHIVQSDLPLTTLLFLLVGNTKELRFLNSKMSYCIRVCIHTDMLNTSLISYCPSYYTKDSGLRQAVLEDMKSRDLISVKSNLLYYNYKIRDYKLYKTVHTQIIEYLHSKEIIFRYDVIILCILYLGRYEIVDFYEKKVPSILERYKEDHIIQELIKKIKQ
ncbi:uncharacterized protein VNE69_03346 [Vairimorpha necatrix]|uniref:Uncharacterized protein n=1 Tax=Vairimorpha necatrix TaxID=6039 RepID=A0AAX4JB93_9MICR